MPMTFQQKPRTHSPRYLAYAVSLTLALASAFVQAQDAATSADATQTAVNPVTSPASTAVTTVGELATVPAPALTARAWMTLDVNSGQIIAAQNLDEPVEPASLTTLISAYVEIGRAHVLTPVTNAHLVCRLLLEKKKTHI